MLMERRDGLRRTRGSRTRVHMAGNRCWRCCCRRPVAFASTSLDVVLGWEMYLISTEMLSDAVQFSDILDAGAQEPYLVT